MQVCPYCECALVSEQAVSVCCPSCLSIVASGKSLSLYHGGYYNFCRCGFFTLVMEDRSRRGRYPSTDEDGIFTSLQQRGRDLAERAASHLLWALVWAALITGFTLFSGSSMWWRIAQTVAWFGLFITMVLACSYGLLLWFRGILRFWMRPNRWDRIIAALKSGDLNKGQGLMEGQDLLGHPGMLANLSIAHFRAGEVGRGRHWLKRALKLCPDHPILVGLAQFHLE